MLSSALRARIATALGLSALFPLVDVHAIAETGGSGGAVTYGTYCEAAPDATTAGAAVVCGDGQDNVGQPVDTGACGVTGVIGQGAYNAETGECCWKVTVDCGIKDDGFYDCGCYGRPLVVDGVVRTAGSTRRRGWRADGVSPGRVAAQWRPALVRFWLENAEAEHSSVAGFAKFALDLLAVGAPAALVARAQQAGVEELAHARACYALASGYAGFALGPRALTSPPLTLAADVIELAVHTAREGCVGETVAAEFAAAIAESATDPAVKAVMTAIAEEEARHAELAWETLAWALRVGGDAVRDAVAAVFAEPFRAPAPAGVEDRPELRAHGLLPDQEQAAICARAHAEVVRALADALLARAAA
jgi:hypothetical protein